MEEKQNLDLDSIDEKLSELKNTVNVPNLNEIFSGFKWTREWFTQAEDALLALAFRDESDRIVVEFIRKQIIDTDIVTFNKILRGFSAAPIRNHYEILINERGYLELFDQCLEQSVMNTIAKDYIAVADISKILDKCLSACISDITVEYLIANPHRILWPIFLDNINLKAVKYCIKQKQIKSTMISSIDDDEIVDFLIANPKYINKRYFCSNPNDKAVRYVIENPSMLNISSFCTNPNNMAVDYIINNSILSSNLCDNTNDRAFEYVLANPEYINWYVLCQNNNNKVAEYVINNSNGDSLHFGSGNPNDKIVDYLISHADEINWGFVYDNPNDKMVEFLLNKIDPVNIKFLINNACKYNMQKLREFNKLGLFPRLAYLVI